MKKLIPVGFYCELAVDAEEKKSLPSITRDLAESPQDHEAKIVAYLRNAVCIGAVGCYVDDVLDPSSRVPLSPHPYTDGTYYWHLDIAHYVEKYHLRLPADFIRHMASMNWQPPSAEQVDLRTLEV